MRSSTLKASVDRKESHTRRACSVELVGSGALGRLRSPVPSRGRGDRMKPQEERDGPGWEVTVGMGLHSSHSPEP